MCGGVHATVDMQMPEHNTVELLFSFHLQLHSEEQTQVPRVAGQVTLTLGPLTHSFSGSFSLMKHRERHPLKSPQPCSTEPINEELSSTVFNLTDTSFIKDAYVCTGECLFTHMHLHTCLYRCMGIYLCIGKRPIYGCHSLRAVYLDFHCPGTHQAGQTVWPVISGILLSLLSQC